MFRGACGGRDVQERKGLAKRESVSSTRQETALFPRNPSDKSWVG